MCIVGLNIWTQQYAAPVVQQPYHNVGHVQGVPQRQRVIYPVRANLSSPRIFSIRPFAIGESRTQWRVLLCSSAIYTRRCPKSPFLIHRLTKFPLVACQHQKISDESLYYVQHPGTRVNSVCMERGTAGRYKVTITLEVSHLL